MVTKVTTFTSRAFRDALSSFATGVTVVTAPGRDGTPVGITASSFNSVSTEPPLILWSVGKTSRSAPSFEAAEYFAVHVLTPEQTDLSNTFAKSGIDKFAQTAFEEDEHGVPILPGTAARFDCRRWAVYEGGDHWIIVGEVLSIDTLQRQGLVFGGGAYSLAAPLEALRPDLAEDGGVGDTLEHQLSQAYHKMVVQFHDVVRQNGLTVDEWRVLSALYAPAPVSFSDLAGQTFLEPATLEATLEAMEEAGLCRRDGAGRGCAVHATAQGRERVTHLIALAQAQERHVLAPLSDEQIAALRDGLRALVAQRDAPP
ncbi:MAG: flavin reductase [Pseudomonadota bacterium]